MIKKKIIMITIIILIKLLTVLYELTSFNYIFTQSI